MHDVVQVAAGLPRQAVLVGHGAGALVVAHALARYPARAGVLLAPVFGGWRTFGAALLRNPFGTVPAIFGGRLRLRRGQLFGPNLHGLGGSKVYLGRLGAASSARPVAAARTAYRRKCRSATRRCWLPAARTTRWCRSRRSIASAARYGGAPLLFPGMGHDMMLDAGWAEPIDAIIDWLSKGER